jgi:hypothetical protein
MLGSRGSLNESWERIPPSKIVPDFAPDGRASLFVMRTPGDTMTEYDIILCFVRPKGGL